LFDLGVSFIAIDLEPEFKSTSSLLFCFMEAAIFVVIEVIDALTSTDVLDKIMPVLKQKITETILSVIESSIQSCVDSNIKPLIETVKRQQITINERGRQVIRTVG
jgi:hypothetical protein